MHFQILNILQSDGQCPQKIQGKLSSSLWHQEKLFLFPADQILFCILVCWLNVDCIVEHIMKQFCEYFITHLLVKGLAVRMAKGMEKV